MSFSQREPIDVNAIYYDRTSIPLHYATTELINKARSIRPYAAAIIRHGIPTPELRELNALEGEEQAAALAEASYVQPINQAMHQAWEANPWNASLTPTDLAYIRLRYDHDAQPHIDQRIKDDSPIPEAGLLVVFAMLDGEYDYGFKADNINPFDPKNHDRFARGTPKPRPARMCHPDPPARAGDVIIMMSHTVHVSGEVIEDLASKDARPRVTAAYLSGIKEAA